MKLTTVLTALLALSLSLGMAGTSFARGGGKGGNSGGAAASSSLSRQGGGGGQHQQIQQRSQEEVQTRSQSQYKYGQGESRPDAGIRQGTGDGTADQLRQGDRLQERIHQVPEETTTGN